MKIFNEKRDKILLHNKQLEMSKNFKVAIATISEISVYNNPKGISNKMQTH